jgi:short-subunit dehydrogenase
VELTFFISCVSYCCKQKTGFLIFHQKAKAVNILLLGVSSDTAKATARYFAARGANHLMLAGRSVHKISPLAQDIKIRYGVSTHCLPFDALDYQSHYQFYEKLPVRPDLVICLFGYKGDPEKAGAIFSESSRIIDINYKGMVSILNIVAADFAKTNQGTIVAPLPVVHRAMHYVHFSVVEALAAYLSALGDFLKKHGARVVIVRTGEVFGDNRNTHHPDRLASAIHAACMGKADTYHTDTFWRRLYQKYFRSKASASAGSYERNGL